MYSKNKDHWVCTILGYLSDRGLHNNFFASVFLSGVIPTVYLAILLLIRQECMLSSIILGYLGGCVWLSIGPFLISLYCKISRKFFENIADNLCNKSKINSFELSFFRKFNKLSLLSSVIWGVICVFLWGISNLLSMKMGISGIKDPMYWIGLVIVAWSGILIGVGFTGVLFMVVTVSKLARNLDNLEPMHHDNRGGLGYFGDYAINTTLMFASGALFVPFILTGIGSSKAMFPYVIILLGVFSFFVLLSFIYPIFVVRTEAIKLRNEILSLIVNRYRHIVGAGKYVMEKLDLSESSYFELSVLNKERTELRNINLYPINIEVLTKLVFSTLLPFLMFLLESTVKKLL